MSNKSLYSEICKERFGGLSYGEIGKKYKKPKSSIQRIVDSYGKQPFKRGPKEKLLKNHKRRIKMQVDQNFKDGKKSSARHIIEELNLPISKSTVYRTMKTLNYKYANLPSKFSLTSKQKQKRIEVVRSFIKDRIDWNLVIFSDEKRFSLMGCDSHYTWIHSSQSPKRVRNVIRSPGLMIWAMIMPSGLLSYQIMRGKQNSQKYINIISSYAMPIININYKENMIFQQDNCPIHVSKETKNFFKKINIDLLDWPPYSPDLNIIENIWHILSEMVYDGTPIRNLKELEDRIYDAVKNFNVTKQQQVDNLYKSMSSRLCHVLEKKGDRLKY